MEDRVKEITLVEGTNEIQLLGGVSKHVTFSSVVSDSEVFYYFINSNTNYEWEIGLGIWTSTGTIKRVANNVIDGSSGARTLTNFSIGKKFVSMVIPDKILNDNISNVSKMGVRGSWGFKPGYIMIGDSIAANGNRVFTPTSITSSGTTATITFSGNHNLSVNSPICIHNADQPEYNGYFRIITTPSTTVATYTMTGTPAASPATGSITGSGQEYMSDNNWAGVSNAISGNKGLFLGNYARSGATTDELPGQIALGIQPKNNLWSTAPDIAFVNIGINDVLTEVPHSTITSNITTAVLSLRDAGITPVLLTLWPLSDSHGAWTIERGIAARKLSKWIIENEDNLGYIVVDANSACVDNTSLFGTWLTDYSSDGVHPLKRATYAVAKLIKTVLWDHITSTDSRTLTDVHSNTTMEGTAGSNSGTGTSGSVATSFTNNATGGGSQTSVASKGISLTGDNHSQRLVATGAANQDAVILDTGTLHTGMSEGDVIICQATYRSTADLSAENIRFMALSQSMVAGGIFAQNTGNNSNSGNSGFTTEDPYYFVMETPPVKIPSNLTAFRYQLITSFTGAGTVTADISDMHVYKVT